MAEHSVLQLVTHDIGYLARTLHSSPHLQYIVLIILAFTLAGYLADNHAPTAADPREPRKLGPAVPLVGHLVGMFTRHTRYYDDLYRENGMAIATLPMPGGKMYAVWDTALIQAGLRAKTITFDAIMVQHAGGLLGLRKQSVDIARDGMLADLMHVTKPILAGEPLARINLTVLNHAAVVLNEIRERKAFEVPDLYDWVQTTATLAITEALYGSANPLHGNPGLVDDVWSFESGLRRLALNILPSLIAPRAYRARDRLVAALAPLFDETADRKIELPELTRKRVEVIRSHGITDPHEVARVELALLHGATVNTVPSLFWTIAHVFSRPELAAAIRNEALPHVRFAPASPEGERQEAHFPIKRLDSACPLLLSTYQEVTRLVNKAMSTRHVMEDTVLTDPHGREYLLRAGNTVVMPATAHSAAHVWGPDVAEFKPGRFLDWSDRAARERHAAYMPFGGGKHLCPGRNLAKAEILGSVVALALAFDVEDAAAGRSGRPITVPEIGPARLGQGVGKPGGLERGKKLAVRFRTRKGWEDIRWKFVL